jgi:hypothetical protein
VRQLRDIERKNKSVRGTTITAIATALKVPPDEITLPASNETTPDENYRTRLKLRAVRSASELYHQAVHAHRYTWDLMNVDPTPAAAKEMQQLLHVIRRLVERDSVTDEFDSDNVTGSAEPPDNFGLITRLARVQELLDALLAGGVGVLAGSYFNDSWTSLEDPGLKLDLSLPGILPETPAENVERLLELVRQQERPAPSRAAGFGGIVKSKQILVICFAPGDLEEKVIFPKEVEEFVEKIKRELKSRGLLDE